MTEVEVKEKPILFSGEMVRQILGGRKSQTRRVVKPQPPHSCWYTMSGAGDYGLCFGKDPVTGKTLCVPPKATSMDHRLPSPYIAGDHLWVRENFSVRGLMHGASIRDVAKYSNRETCIVYAADGKRGKEAWKWRPSIHMPRWASRLTLEITEARVERLNAITTADAIAEGMDGRYAKNVMGKLVSCEEHAPRRTPVEQFAELWQAINGKRDGCGWAQNPHVWVVSFRRLEQPQ